MRYSRYFLPVLKEQPSEAKIISHSYMLRAGMIKQASAGIYSWLPLGLKVLDKITKIIDQEQQKAGHIPMLMPTIQSADLWQESGRFADYGDEMLRIRDRQGRDLLYGPTNEELITDIFRTHVNSYKDLPLTLYQNQWKFRDEIRPRFGVMRGREFYMKDGYSFDIDQDAALHSYNRHMLSYLATYKRMGLKAIPMRADSGPIGGNNTHEFLIVSQVGESSVFYDNSVNTIDLNTDKIDFDNPEQCSTLVQEWLKPYACTEENHNPHAFAQIPKDRQMQSQAIEVGQIFYFGTKYSLPMKACVSDKDSNLTPVHMGSYGIGISRLVGAIIEANHDDKGIVWPAHVAPFQCGLINVNSNDTHSKEVCETLYRALQQHGLDVLYDDRHERPGIKFSTFDLIGIPWRLTVGIKGLKQNKVELTNRHSGCTEMLDTTTAITKLVQIFK